MLFDVAEIPTMPTSFRTGSASALLPPRHSQSQKSLSPSFLLGLPYLAENELVQTARELNAPVLLSANALSKWRKDANGIPTWCGFNKTPLRHAHGLKIHLDSAGFVAAAKYRRFPWTVCDYMDLCEAAPWEWFASMDWCVENQVAPNAEIVLNRVSGTVRLNTACALEAERRGIASRLMPVIQGWRPDDYLRCIDRMLPLIDGKSIIGVGSMCRRHVAGQSGIVQILDALDQALGSDPVRFHLFGLKSSALALIAGHPRVASADSQAYGIQARRAAIQIRETQAGFSKSNSFTAAIMRNWYLAQLDALRTSRKSVPRATGILPLPPSPPSNPFEARYQQAAEEVRQLHETGEIDFGDINPAVIFAWAFDDDHAEDKADI